MAQILPLSVLSRLVTVQALLDLRDHSPHAALYIQKLLQANLYTAVSESILQQIVEQFPSRLHCELVKVLTPPHIRELKLRKCWSVSVSALADILLRCCRIQMLDLSECDHLMQPPFFKLLHKVAPQLTCITLENCELVNDNAVRAILGNNPALRQLNISMCENVTDKAFLLDEKLQLSRETNIKVHGVDRHGYPCQLTHIDVSGCRVLTSSGIRYLTTLCGPTLQHVNISYTEVDSTALWYLAGYGLTSAVHMAIAYMMEVNTDGMATEQLSELVKYMSEVSLGADDFSDYSEGSDTETEGQPTKEDANEEANTSKSKEEVDNFVENGTQEGLECSFASTEATKNLESLGRSCDLKSDKPGTNNACDNERCTLFDVEMMPILDVTFHKCSCDNQNMVSEFHKNSCPTQTTMVQGGIPAIEIESCPAEGITYEKELQPCDEAMCSCEVQHDTENVSLLSENASYCSPSLEPNRRFSNPLELHRCGYGEGVEGLSPQCPPSRKSSDISDLSMYDNQNDHDDFDCPTPKNSPGADGLTDNSDNNGACLGIKKLKPRDEHPISEDFQQPQCSVPFQQSPLLDDPSSIWVEVSDNDMGNAGAVAHMDSPSNIVPNTIKNKMKPDLSVEFQNDTVKLPPPLPKRNCGRIDASSKKPYSELLQIYEPNIRVLDVSHIAFNSKELVHSCMKAFFQRNRHIQQLFLTWKELGDDMLKYIADHARELKALSLVDCDGLTSDGVAYVSQQCPQLSRLNLQGVCFISNQAVEDFILSGKLTGLNMAETNITDHSLRRLAQHGNEQLQELDLSWCEELLDEQHESSPGLNALLSSCVNLRSLLLRHLPCSPGSLQLLVTHCLQLKVLNLSSVNSLSDKLLIAMSVRLKKLEKLDISWNSALTDLGVGAIMANCLYLQEVSVAGIKLLTSKPFLPLISEVKEWRRCQALLRLKLQEQRMLDEADHYSSDEEFESLCLPHRSTCFAPHLRWLDAEYCDKVNDTHLAEIVAVCRGTLRARDYYGQNVTPSWIQCKRGKVFLAPTV